MSRGHRRDAVDRFGEVLSGSKYTLLVVVPKEDVGDVNRRWCGLRLRRRRLDELPQDTTAPAVPTAAKGNDRFGQSVAQLPSCSGVAGQDADVAAAPGRGPHRCRAGWHRDDRGSTTPVFDVSLTQTHVRGTAEPGDKFGRRGSVAGNFLVAVCAERGRSGKAGKSTSAT